MDADPDQAAADRSEMLTWPAFFTSQSIEDCEGEPQQGGRGDKQHKAATQATTHTHTLPRD